MGIQLHQTWAGVGIKVGGIALLGFDSFEGLAFRLDGIPANSSHDVAVGNLRLGLGLGGQIGGSFIFAFNTNTLWEVNNLTLTDWGANLALPGSKINAGSVTLKALKACKNLKDIVTTVKKTTPKDMEFYRNIASVLYSTLADVKEGVGSNKPSVVVIDMPGVGAGVEVSVFASGGEFLVKGKTTGLGFLPS